MNENQDVNRRHFLGAAGLGLLGITSWLSGCTKGSVSKAEKPPLDSRFNYDVSQFERTDPALMLYREEAPIQTALEAPKCLAIGKANTVFVGGDRALKIFDASGKLASEISFTEKPLAISATDERVCVTFRDHLEIFAPDGKLLAKGDPVEGKTYLTGVADGGSVIYLADAGNRDVIRCDGSGKILDRFGRNNGNPGFVIPSPYFHIMIGSDGLVWVNNPGRHQIEAYTADGHFELAWGTASMAVQDFCGCCNPVFFSRRPDGKFVTSEKGLNRIKIYDAQGKFEGVVAGPEQLVKDLELAKKACTDCQVGFGFDVACDSTGRVLALDPAAKTVRVFTLKSA